MHELIVTVITDSDESDHATYSEVRRYTYESHDHLLLALRDLTRYITPIVAEELS